MGVFHASSKSFLLFRSITSIVYILLGNRPMIRLKIGTFMSQPDVLCLGEDTCLLSDMVALFLYEG